MAETPTIDRLLNLVPDSSSTVLSYLQSHPDLASKQDAHGYSLLHAATSYGQVELLKALAQKYKVDPNMMDEDGETCLFNAETVEIAKELVRLGVSLNAKNDEGQTAAEKLDDEDEQPLVAAYLREVSGQPAESAVSTLAQTDGASGSVAAQSGTLAYAVASPAQPPPPIPNGVQINMSTMHLGDEGEAPDPEFRRRIEELASRDDFQGEEGQAELRKLVTDAISGLAEEGQAFATRRRIG